MSTSTVNTFLRIEPIDFEPLGIKKNSLKDKVAVITGSASNIGLGYARAVAWAGGNVVLSDINEDAGKEAMRVINEENQRDAAVFVNCDVTKQEDVKNQAKTAFDKFGKVDILVNNAMNMKLNGSILSSTVDDLDQSYYISGRGVMLAIKEYVPGMIERKYGVVIFSATQFHYHPPMIGGSIYTAGKAAAASLVMSLANELKDTGVSSFCLTPAGVNRFDAVNPGTPFGRPDIDRKKAKMPGFDGYIPPEVGGAGLVYSILNHEKLNGSGFIMNDVLDAMDYPFPVPETAVRNKMHRLSDFELTMVLCNMGSAFEGGE